MSKQIELHLHYPFKSSCTHMGPQRLLHYKRKKKPFNLLANPRFVSGLVCVLWFVYARDQKDILPRAPAAGWGARTFSLQTSTNTHRSKKTLRVMTQKHAQKLCTCAYFTTITRDPLKLVVCLCVASTYRA